MDERTFTASEVVGILDRAHRRLDGLRDKGLITRDDKFAAGKAIASVADLFGLTNAYIAAAGREDARDGDYSNQSKEV